MSEIYWITRLNAILSVFGICILLVIAVLVALCVSYIWELGEGDDKTSKIGTRIKNTTILLISLLTIKAFIPTTKEMVLITGIGGTIDYIKTDSTAKQIPHKCIEAIDKWLEEYNNK